MVSVQFDPSRSFFLTLQGHCGKNVANQGPWIGTTKGEWTKGARIISSPSGTTKKKHKSLGGYWVSSYEQESSRQRKTTGDAGKVMAIFLCVFFCENGFVDPNILGLWCLFGWPDSSWAWRHHSKGLSLASANTKRTEHFKTVTGDPYLSKHYPKPRQDA